VYELFLKVLLLLLNARAIIKEKGVALTRDIEA